MTNAMKISRIAANSPRGSKNAYIDLFYDALAEKGVDMVGVFEPTIAWLRQHAGEVDAVHFHWSEPVLRRYPRWFRELDVVPGFWRIRHRLRRRSRPTRLVQFHRFLRNAKRMHLQVIWTVHNLQPHEGAGWVDHIGHRLLAEKSNLLIFHSECAKHELLKKYRPTGELVVMPHGNYDGIYPEPRARQIVRHELGFREDLPLLTCLGAIRDYKGFDLACEAVSRMAGRFQLLIAGQTKPTIENALRKEVKQTPNSKLIARSLSDQEFADYATASDAILLPYRKITGSGALLAALTLGRGVIASDLPYFREVLSNHGAGVLFEPGNVDAMIVGIERFFQWPVKERGAAARQLADALSWRNVVRPVCDYLGGGSIG